MWELVCIPIAMAHTSDVCRSRQSRTLTSTSAPETSLERNANFNPLENRRRPASPERITIMIIEQYPSSVNEQGHFDPQGFIGSLVG